MGRVHFHASNEHGGEIIPAHKNFILAGVKTFSGKDPMR